MMEVFSPWDGKPKAGDPVTALANVSVTARGSYYSESQMSVNVTVPAGRTFVLTGLHVSNVNGIYTYPYNNGSSPYQQYQPSVARATFNGHTAKHEFMGGPWTTGVSGSNAAFNTMSDSWQGMDVINGGASGVTLTLTVFNGAYGTGATATVGGYLI